MAQAGKKPERHLLKRSFAYLLDSFITVFIMLAGFAPFIAVSMLAEKNGEPIDAGAAVACGIIALMLYATAMLFFLVRDGLARSSPGKRMMGLMVVDIKTGERCTKKQSAVRNFILLVLGAVDLMIPFINKDGRRFGDHVAGTLVIGGG